MTKECRRNIIIYIPYSKEKVRSDYTNDYTYNMIQILKGKYTVDGKLASPINVVQMLKTKAVFLNWVEGTGMGFGMKLQILLHKLYGAKIIWVFHNRYPHDHAVNRISSGNMHWLAKHCSVIMLHAKSSVKYIPNASENKKKAVYVPHVLYQSHSGDRDVGIALKKYKIKGSDFVFLMFGIIRPYKKIEKGIEAFQKLRLENAKLIIAGAPADMAYAREIARLCKNADNIILDMHYLSNSALESLIDASDVVLVPYKNASSINSGVMIQALSRGTPVIVPDICMARDLAAYNFFYMYRSSLEEAMLKAYTNGKELNRFMGNRGKDFLYRNNNEKVVKDAIEQLLG